VRAFALAGRFLTVLPWPGAPEEPQPEEMAAAVVRFPLVGLALGAVLVALDVLLSILFPLPVRDAALVAALVLLTGCLHLDGLADWADALGGGASRERRLEIMKDSNCGPMGAAAIALALLLKYAALSVLHGPGRWSALLLAPVLGRAAMAYLLASLPYARREGGTGASFAEAAGSAEGYTAAAWAAALSVVFGFLGGALVALGAAALTLGMWHLLDRTLGGGTGDGYGAAGEIVETGAFLLLAAWWGL